MESSKQIIRWVLRAQAGDREAFDELLKTIAAPLFRYVRSLAGKHAQAEDILQEVFLIMYRKLVWLRDPELFRPWAYRIATREAFRQLKRENRWTDEEIIPQSSPPPVFPRELLASLPQLLERLSPASRA